MITYKDVGKECFLRIDWTYLTNNNIDRKWERVGAKIAGEELDGKVPVRLSNGNIAMVRADCVRVIEPRPQNA